MGDKKPNTTSKTRICDAVLTGLLRKDLRLVGYWLVANQSHQIDYHRQKIHSLKTRIGGESAFDELLQCVSGFATALDDVSIEQHGSKPAAKLESSEPIISADWMTAFSGVQCTDNQSQPSTMNVAQQLSEQLSSLTDRTNPSEHTLNPPPVSIIAPARMIPNDRLIPANILDNTYNLLPEDIYGGFEQRLVQQTSGSSSENSFVTQSTCIEHSNGNSSIESCIESLELAGQFPVSDTYPKWTESSAFEAAELFLRRNLTKDHQDLLSYVINIGVEMEQKCLDVMDSVRTWNSWSAENLHLVPIKTDNQPKVSFPPLSLNHKYAGWKIHLEDRPRQRYTKRTVQKWMTYMAHRTMGVWQSCITAKNFREALENGGMFCTIGGSRQEDLSYNILGGRRNHVTKVEALNIRCGQFDKEYEFKRYDTDLILPEYILKNPLPRVIVFESQQLNLRAVMFIIRHPLEKGRIRRPAKRAKKFDTLLGGELQIDQPTSSVGPPDMSSCLQSNKNTQLKNAPYVDVSTCTELVPAEELPIDNHVIIPRLKVEQVDENDSVSHQIIENELDPSKERFPCSPTNGLSTSQWGIGDEDLRLSRDQTSNTYDWGGVYAGTTELRPFESCWYSAEGTTEDVSSAFEDAIFAAAASEQQVKRIRTSLIQY